MKTMIWRCYFFMNTIYLHILHPNLVHRLTYADGATNHGEAEHSPLVFTIIPPPTFHHNIGMHFFNESAEGYSKAIRWR